MPKKIIQNSLRHIFKLLLCIFYFWSTIIVCCGLQILESAINIIPEDLTDSKVLVANQLLQANNAVKEEPVEDPYVDSLDQMMCKIADDMT